MAARSLRGFHRALHHVIVVQRIPRIPGLAVPVLYLSEPDGLGGETLRPLESLTDYFIAHSARSMSWMLHCARGIGAIYDYTRQRGDHFRREAARRDVVNIHRLVLSEFQNHLLRGTVTAGPEGLRDDTGLFWLPAASMDGALNLGRAVHGFINWLAGLGYGDCLVPGTEDEERLAPDGDATVRFLYVATVRKRLSMLAHIKESHARRAPAGREIIGRDTRSFEARDTVQFPREYFAKLILEGFVSNPNAADPCDREDWAGKIGTCLCGGIGIRSSEALHFWVNDIQLVEGVPTAFLHHPVLALVDVPGQGRMTRAEYLRTHCGMEPRNREHGRLHAGWKGLRCNSDWWAPGYWLPFEGLQDIFWQAVQTYVFEVRPALMAKRRRRGLPDHPFLLVSAGECGLDVDTAGDPYTRAAFRKSWARAMARLHKRYNDDALLVAKRRGTTAHGLRHLYGGVLAELGLAPKMIQECMHHISPFSQITYTKPRSETINEQLSLAAARIRRGEPGRLDDPAARFRTQAEALIDLRARTLGSLS